MQCFLGEAAVCILVVQLLKVAKLGIEYLHCLFAQVLDISLVLLDKRVGAGVVDILGIGNGRFGR